METVSNRVKNREGGVFKQINEAKGWMEGIDRKEAGEEKERNKRC